jgi:hypothetical protein
MDNGGSFLIWVSGVECFPRGLEVNNGGWTTWLWKKPIFGICGELW